ncbi:MAG: hypothetical protein JXQ68_04810 [Campylobacterales bacterium]|nr:hypothetical protein [Campylobacterales bacterium]
MTIKENQPTITFEPGDKFILDAYMRQKKIKLTLTLTKWKDRNEGILNFKAKSKEYDPRQPYHKIDGYFIFNSQNIFEVFKSIFLEITDEVCRDDSVIFGKKIHEFNLQDDGSLALNGKITSGEIKLVKM